MCIMKYRLTDYYFFMLDSPCLTICTQNLTFDNSQSKRRTSPLTMRKTPKSLLLVFFLLQAVFTQGRGQQLFRIYDGQTPSTGHNLLTSYSVRSHLGCAADCIQNPSCVALSVNQTSFQPQCSLHDIVSVNTVLTEEYTSYMFKKGM